ncbi:accessory Sec system S-layer assembly protein [Salimicrobium halophilum]|uniref:Accessory Sec system S-layer assembly protein n=1 Tax=Salimicrobium halophilum TaxID=86666 RepID=A0A1G8S0N5_9BACI|nr:accessory Sec system S-layer assembly protein [Salimicrobium halophilum]SDJ22778.1 accessory Sec system S-layer assembly protein [Salimicrobium halophilum]
MLNFFKKNKQQEQNLSSKNGNSTIDASELFDDTQEDHSERLVETPLSLPPEWKISEEEIYVFRFKNNENEPLKPNQVSLAGYEMDKSGADVNVGGFIRHSLPKSISFNETTVVLMNEEGQRLARASFDLSKAGELPPESSRPHPFIFQKKDLLVEKEEIPTEGWKLAFELKKKPKHSLDLHESWEQSMADEDVSQLEEFVSRLKAPKQGEVNFMGVKAKQAENNDLHVTILIRNGSEKNIELQQVPLQIEDNSGEVIAKGGFTLEDFEVKSNTSKPWTFIFPASLLQKEHPDLSSFKAYPIQK